MAFGIDCSPGAVNTGYMRHGVLYDVTTEDIAAHFKLCVEHVRWLHRQGRFGSIKIGRRLYFNSAEVERYMIRDGAARSNARGNDDDGRAFDAETEELVNSL